MDEVYLCLISVWPCFNVQHHIRFFQVFPLNSSENVLQFYLMFKWSLKTNSNEEDFNGTYLDFKID